MTIWNDNNASPWFYQDVSGSVLVDRLDGLPSDDPNHIFYQLTALNTENTVARGGAAADSFSINAPSSAPFTAVGAGGLDTVSMVTGQAVCEASEDLASLNIPNGASAIMNQNGNKVLVVNQLFMGSNAVLDLTNNDLHVRSGSSSTINTIRAAITTVRNGGAGPASGSRHPPREPIPFRTPRSAC